MLALSWVFLAVAIATLVLGATVFNDKLTLVWVSIGSSALAMIFLLTSILRRKPVQPATAGAPYGPTPEEAATRGQPAAAAATAPAAAPAPAPAPPAAPQRRPAQAPAVAPVPPPSEAPEAAPVAEAAPTATRKTAAKKTTAKKPAAKKPAVKKPAAKKPAAAKKTPAKKSAAKKTAAAGTSSRTTVVAIPERGTFHTSSCRYVQDRDDTERVQMGTAKNRGYTACKVCKPES